MNTTQSATYLHENVPPDWYARSIKNNIFQWFWHNRRFQQVKKMVINSGGIILDIGCADGTFTKVIFDQADPQKIIGIDVLKNSVAFARKRFSKNKRMVFRIADAHSLPFRARLFDWVFCLEALEHVFDPPKVLREIHRVLKVGGYAVILVPSESLLFRIVWWLWQKWPGKNIWEHAHLHNFSNGFLEELLDKSDLKIIENDKFLFGMLHLIKVRK